MHPHLLGRALRAPLPSCVAERADQLFLFGVHRNHRLALGQGSRHALADVAELRVAVGVAAALQRFAVGLQAEPLPLQQCAHHRVADRVALRLQRSLKLAQAQAGPAQGRHGVTPLGRAHQRQQGAKQPRVGRHQGLAPATLPAHPAQLQRLRLVQLPQAASDGAPRDPRRTRHSDDAAVARRPRLGGRKQPAPSLVQVRRQACIPQTDQLNIDHPPRLCHPNKDGNPKQ